MPKYRNLLSIPPNIVYGNCTKKLDHFSDMENISPY